MTAELEKLGTEYNVTLLPEGRGIFDVKIDGKLIYSKYETGRFPNQGEITSILEAG